VGYLLKALCNDLVVLLTYNWKFGQGGKAITVGAASCRCSQLVIEVCMLKTAKGLYLLCIHPHSVKLGPCLLGTPLMRLGLLCGISWYKMIKFIYVSVIWVMDRVN